MSLHHKPIWLLLVLVLTAPRAFANETAGEEALTLNGLLQAALAHDGRVLAAHAELDGYRARYKEASWLWFPAAKLDVLFGGPVGQRRLLCKEDEAADPYCVQLKDTTPWSFGDLSEGVSFAVGAKLEAVMPIYTFGKLSSAKDAAVAGISAGEAGIDKARQEVAREVRRAYYGWLLACETVEILEEGVDKLADAEKKLQKLLDELNEDVTLRDKFKLRFYSAEVKTMLLQARQGQDLALSALRFLTGIPGLGVDRSVQAIDLKTRVVDLKDQDAYIAQARTQRAELRQLRAARDAASAVVELQKASFYPDFFIAGSISASYSPAHDLIENSLLNRGFTYYDFGLTLGLRMQLDIPQKIARLEKSDADLARLDALTAQAEAAVGLEIERHLAELTTARETMKIVRRGRRSAKSWMRANFMNYGVGIADTKDLLDSLAADARARMAMNKAYHDTLIAQDALQMAAGEDLGRAK